MNVNDGIKILYFAEASSGGIAEYAISQVSALEAEGGKVTVLCRPEFPVDRLSCSEAIAELPRQPKGKNTLTRAIDYLRDLVHLSLVLAVQVAAPMLAIMSLIALTMGFLGHTVPQINVLVVGFPIRALANMLILLLTLSGAARLVVDLVPAVIDNMRGILTGYG